MAAQVLTNPKAIRAVKGMMVKVEDAIDASARAAIDIEAIPKVRQDAQPKAEGATPQKLGAKQAPDGKWYLPPGSDPKNPDKFIRVDAP